MSFKCVRRLIWNQKSTLQYRKVFEDGLVLNYFDKNTGADTFRQKLMTHESRTSGGS